MKIEHTIAAIAAVAGLALAGCDTKDSNGNQGESAPDFADVKKETVEALKATGGFIETKAEEGGKAIVAAGEKAGEAVKESVDEFKDQSNDTKDPEPDPKPGRQ